MVGEDAEHVRPSPQALGPAVVPLDEDLELIGIEHMAAQTDTETWAKELDPVALARDAGELSTCWLGSAGSKPVIVTRCYQNHLHRGSPCVKAATRSWVRRGAATTPLLSNYDLTFTFLFRPYFANSWRFFKG